MSVKVKICGLTNLEDAQWAVNLGADFLGFNFWSQSPRKVSPELASSIAPKLPPFVQSVGVFVDQPRADIVKIVRKVGLKGVQLHGEQSSEETAALAAELGAGIFICRAFRVKSAEDLAPAAAFQASCKYFLVDARSDEAPGGTGQPFPWALAQNLKPAGVPFFVAGGLTPENVADAVEATQPFGVDVASGVEKSPKRKDYDKMKSFIQKAKT